MHPIRAGEGWGRHLGQPIHLDSLLVGPHETWEVAFAAGNPGIWMLHCHVLLHASFGMSMTVNYLARLSFRVGWEMDAVTVLPPQS